MPVDVHYYFAYGSNMNPERMKERMGEEITQTAQVGRLADYRMKFNKRSRKYGVAANVVHEKGALTEGVLYRLQSPDQIKQMDPNEGYLGPSNDRNQYDRKPLPIRAENDMVDAWVYIATDDFIREGLAPERCYLNHLLAGRRFLSESYVHQLQQITCFEDS